MNFKAFLKWSMWTGVLAIAGFSFTLSFDVLKNEAALHGVNKDLAWIFPVVVDGAVIIFTLFSVYGAMVKSNAIKHYGYFLIAVVTAASIYLNFKHAPDGESVIFYVTAPVLLALSIHGASMLLGGEVMTSKRTKRKAVTPTESDQASSVTIETTDTKTVKVEVKQSVAERRQMVLQVFGQGVTSQRGIAKQIGTTAPTVGRDMEALFTQGMLQKDKSGRYTLTA